MSIIVTPEERLSLRSKLREHFGFRHFRSGQEQVVAAAMQGRDTVVIMPTGSGKSLCYQLPGLALDGTTVVVSPLLALMKDQAESLARRGFPVTEVNSTLSARELKAAADVIAVGVPDFVFTTPERMADPEFREILGRRKIDLFVIDEAHCISQWGHDFRPDYLDLGAAIAALGHPPVLAMTATATPEVIDDLVESLGLDAPELVHTGFDRPNLALAVVRADGDDAKRNTLLRLLSEQQGDGIIYCATVKAAEELSDFLRGLDLPVASYHGRLPHRLRTRAQEQFMRGEVQTMVATNAFGMGIDKPDIRSVIHYHVPGTIEAYYQEVGRAGRDGLPARGILLYDPADRALQSFFRGRMPGAEDLVNAHHTLARLDDGGPQSPAPGLADLMAISPLPKTRLRVCLGLLERFGAVRRAEAGRGYRLARRELTLAEAERLASRFRERDERGRMRQERMIAYAESSRCRWASVLDYFGPDDSASGPCGRCDQCAGPDPDPATAAMAG